MKAVAVKTGTPQLGSVRSHLQCEGPAQGKPLYEDEMFGDMRSMVDTRMNLARAPFTPLGDRQ
jgi:hypothetical protein